MSAADYIDEALSGPRLPAHLYLHVPVCRVKCSYCDFYSDTDIGGQRVGALIASMEAQIQQWTRIGLPGVLETVYVGGGTPTLLAAGLVQLVRAALENLPARSDCEVTVEANPDSVTPDIMQALAATGVTRVSLGVQSLVDTELGMLGRVHTVEEAVAAARAVNAAGLDLSLDLMCGIPGQTLPSWLVTLEAALQLAPEHVSVYPLTLEEGTPLEVACATGLEPEPDPDLAAQMMLAAEERLRMDGLERYEVANYAKPGHESRHNIAYWTGRSYIGIGPAAHGMIDVPTAALVGLGGHCAPDAARVRYAERADTDAWIGGAAPEVECLSAEEAAREDVMLGLRLTQGVSASAAELAGVTSVLERLEERGLVERYTAEDAGGERWWRTTRRGWLLGNEVFGDVWSGE